MEEQTQEDIKIEAFKAAILTAFPSKKLYESLYGDKDEEPKYIDLPLNEYTDLQDIMDIINSTEIGSEADING